MALNSPNPTPVLVGSSKEIVFAGDQVRLAGQIDYPYTGGAVIRSNMFPIAFILHHACCNAREDYAAYAQAALEAGYAVFRWDKRGTGRSGASGQGSTTQDAVNAYEIALEQAGVNRKRAVIIAVGAGTRLLGSSFGLFARVQHPHGAVLVANALDERAIVAIDTNLQILVSGDDWQPAQQFAQAAAHAHAAAYRYRSSYYITHGADRLLKLSNGALHSGARKAMGDWLRGLNPVYASV